MATMKHVPNVNAEVFVPGQSLIFGYGNETITLRKGIIDVVHNNRVTLRVFNEYNEVEFKSFNYSKMSDVIVLNW